MTYENFMMPQCQTPLYVELLNGYPFIPFTKSPLEYTILLVHLNTTYKPDNMHIILNPDQFNHKPQQPPGLVQTAFDK